MHAVVDKSTWKKVKLDDVVIRKEENDKEHARERFDRFIKVEHMDAESLHLKRWGDQGVDELPPTFYKIFRKGQILFPTRNPHLRRTALAHFDGICGEKTLTLEPKSEIVDPKYLPFLFNSEGFVSHTTSAIIGSTNPHVRWRDVGNYQFLLPPKDQQERLAGLLLAADYLLEEQRYLLNQNERLYSSAIEDKIQIGGTEIWELRDLVDVRKGLTYKSDDYSDIKNGIPLLNLKSIEIKGGFNREGIKYYNGSYNEEHFAKPTDLIMACTDITRMGNVVGYPLHPAVHKSDKMLFTMDLIALSVKRKELLRDYLYYVLKTNWAHNFLFARSPGTTVLHLDLKAALKLKIPQKTVEEQTKLVQSFGYMENNIESTKKAVRSSEVLIKSLINQIF